MYFFPQEIKQAAAAAAAQSTNTSATSSVPPPPVLRKDREKSDDSDLEQRFEDAQCVTLIKQINTQVRQYYLPPLFFLTRSSHNLFFEIISLGSSRSDISIH